MQKLERLMAHLWIENDSRRQLALLRAMQREIDDLVVGCESTNHSRVIFPGDATTQEITIKGRAV